MKSPSARLIISTLSENRWIDGARVLLVILLMAAPLAFGAVEPWAWATIIVGTIITGVLWVSACVMARELDVRWTALYVPLVSLLIVISVQRIWNVTVDPIGARESWVKLAAYLGIFFLSRELFGRASQTVWSWLGLAVTIYGFAMALFAIIQFFSSPGLLYGIKAPRFGGIVFGPYVNHNHFAGLMEILIPIAMGYVVSVHRGSAAQPILVFTILVSVASVLLSGSRGGIIALFGEYLIFGILLLRKGAEYGRGRVAVLAGLGFCAAILLLFVWIDPGDVTKRLEQTATSPELNFADRRQYSRDSIKMFRDHPVLGIGVGSFEAAYPSYQSFSSNLIISHAHNDYVEALAESGAVGGFLILLAIVLFFQSVFSGSVPRTKHGMSWVSTGAAIGCCGILIHSFSDFNLHIPANAAWFAFAAGIATINHAKRKTSIGLNPSFVLPSLPAGKNPQEVRR